MNRRDKRIADSCGLGPAEAARIFEENARSMEKIDSDIDGLRWRAAEEKAGDTGETPFRRPIRRDLDR